MENIYRILDFFHVYIYIHIKHKCEKPNSINVAKWWLCSVLNWYQYLALSMSVEETFSNVIYTKSHYRWEYEQVRLTVVYNSKH